MTTYKRKKNTRQRAATTHGYGSMKKNRGAGHRGGRGRAGSGKRGDVKKPSLMWKKGHKHKGKVGFKMYDKKPISAINLSVLEEKADSFIQRKIASKKGDMVVIDLNDIKINKLLGTGKVTLKYEITTQSASERAIEKVEALGGKVIIKEKAPAQGKTADKKDNSSKDDKDNKGEVGKEAPKKVETKKEDKPAEKPKAKVEKESAKGETSEKSEAKE